MAVTVTDLSDVCTIITGQRACLALLTRLMVK